MDLKEKKDKQVLANGSDFDILRKNEAFWQQTVRELVNETISATRDESGEENVSK